MISFFLGALTLYFTVSLYLVYLTFKEANAMGMPIQRDEYWEMFVDVTLWPRLIGAD